jgi:hypothetical protein
MKPGHADADAGADHSGDADISWKMVAGRDALDPDAAGDQQG